MQFEHPYNKQQQQTKKMTFGKDRMPLKLIVPIHCTSTESSDQFVPPHNNNNGNWIYTNQTYSTSQYRVERQHLHLIKFELHSKSFISLQTRKEAHSKTLHSFLPKKKILLRSCEKRSTTPSHSNYLTSKL